MSVTVPEVEWDSDEREKMLALAELERHVHARCGMPLEDVLDPAAEGDPQLGIPARYKAGLPHRCWYCTARDIAADEIRAEAAAGRRSQVEALIVPVIDRGRDR